MNSGCLTQIIASAVTARLNGSVWLEAEPTTRDSIG